MRILNKDELEKVNGGHHPHILHHHHHNNVKDELNRGGDDIRALDKHHPHVLHHHSHNKHLEEQIKRTKALKGG